MEKELRKDVSIYDINRYLKQWMLYLQGAKGVGTKDDIGRFPREREREKERERERERERENASYSSREPPMDTLGSMTKG